MWSKCCRWCRSLSARKIIEKKEENRSNVAMGKYSRISKASSLASTCGASKMRKSCALCTHSANCNTYPLGLYLSSAAMNVYFGCHDSKYLPCCDNTALEQQQTIRKIYSNTGETHRWHLHLKSTECCNFFQFSNNGCIWTIPYFSVNRSMNTLSGLTAAGLP